jgi:arsenical pump membrane protein
MLLPTGMALSIYIVCALALLGVVLRPWRSPEVLWAMAGAVVLVVSGLVPWADAAHAVAKGTDVYLFLIGMMLLSAMAEREGLFDYLASACVSRAGGSARSLFLLVYGVGTVVTVFMSNDATAVVLTPAVLAVCRKAKARPLPYLLACALIANAASFVLPISNPANLVVFGDKLPALTTWMASFLLPSLLSIVATYVVLTMLWRRDLAQRISAEGTAATLATSGKLAAAGVAATAAVLLGASFLHLSLGSPTLLATATAWIAILIRKRQSPWPVLGQISWSIVPLVAALFVIVDGLERAGLLQALTGLMRSASGSSSMGTAVVAGAVIAFACNLMNNLPAGLIAGAVVAAAGAGQIVQSAVAIGVDLGPNLSVTGSLATILWLIKLREQGEHVSGWTFLKTGAIAMPVALAAALAGLWLQSVAR